MFPHCVKYHVLRQRVLQATLQFHLHLRGFTQPGLLRYDVLYFPIKKILKGTKNPLEHIL